MALLVKPVFLGAFLLVRSLVVVAAIETRTSRPVSWLNITLSVPRSRLAAAAIGDLIIFAGGRDSAGNPSDVVDVFDLGNNGARTTLSLSVARDFDGGQNMGASCLGKAFFGGGAAARQASAVDIFNGATRTFDPTPPPLSAARSFLATVALPSAGLVLFGGGELAEDEKHPSASKDTAIVDVWDVRRDRWRMPARLSVPRKKLAAAAVENGSVAVFAGGFTSDVAGNNCGSPSVRPGMGCYRNTIDVYDARTGLWSVATPLSEGRMRLAAASVDGCAVFAGGEVNTTHGDASGIVDVLCAAARSSTSAPLRFTRTVAELSARRYELAGVSLGSRAYFAGGNPGVGHGDPSAPGRIDIFDSSTATWSVLTLPTPRDRLAAAAIAARGIVCFGGGEGGGVTHDVVECYQE